MPTYVKFSYERELYQAGWKPVQFLIENPER